MSFIDTIKIGRLNQVYDILYERNNGIQTVSSLTNLPTTKSVVLANLNTSSAISLAGDLKVGEEMQVICNPTASFALEIGDAIEKNFEGTISTTSGEKFGLNIICYDTGKYFLTADVAIGAIKVLYEYIFNVTPNVPGVTITVNGHTISGNKVTVDRLSTVNFKVEAAGYESVSGQFIATPDSNKTIDVTLKKLLAYKKPSELRAGDIYLKNGGFKDKSEIQNIPASDISGVVLCAPYSVMSSEMATDPGNFNLSLTGKSRMYIDILKVSRNEYRNEFAHKHPVDGQLQGVYAVKHFGYYSDSRTQHQSEKIPLELMQPVVANFSNNTVSIKNGILYKCPKYFNLNLLHLHEAFKESYNHQTGKYNYEYYVDNITAHYTQHSFNAVSNTTTQDVVEFYKNNNITPPIYNNIPMWDDTDIPEIQFYAYTCPTLFTLKKFTESDSNMVAVVDSFATIVGDNPSNIRSMINNARIHVSDLPYPYVSGSGAVSPLTKCKHSDGLSQYYYRTDLGVFPPVYESSTEMGVTNLLNTNIPIEDKIVLGKEFDLFPVFQFFYES